MNELTRRGFLVATGAAIVGSQLQLPTSVVPVKSDLLVFMDYIQARCDFILEHCIGTLERGQRIRLTKAQDIAVQRRGAAKHKHCWRELAEFSGIQHLYDQCALLVSKGQRLYNVGHRWPGDAALAVLPEMRPNSRDHVGPFSVLIGYDRPGDFQRTYEGPINISAAHDMLVTWHAGYVSLPEGFLVGQESPIPAIRPK